MNKKNVIWIYVDSVRRYHSSKEEIEAGDDRSRLLFMDEFANESIEFLNTVTSAPSTQMSISAMAAAMPSYFIAQEFGDYFTGNYIVDNNTNLLRENGYQIYGFFQSRRSREFNKNVFTPVSGKYWPDNFSHLDYWDNSKINLAIDSFLNHQIIGPSFFFINYNCRKDPDTGNKVKWAINRFKKSGYDENNTIYILCSDHGYPDFSKKSGNPEFYKEYSRKYKVNISHDLVLTDDNIMIPLFIKYPGCKKNIKVSETISSLDIFPTILELLNIKSENEYIGKNILPLLDNNSSDDKKFLKNRFFRTDSRLKKQVGKATSIRNNHWKYIHYEDNLRSLGNEQFFDLKNDPFENKNLINSNKKTIKSKILEFRNEFKKSETLSQNYYYSNFFKKLFNDKNEIFSKKNILVFTDNAEDIVEQYSNLNTLSNIQKYSLKHNCFEIDSNTVVFDLLVLFSVNKEKKNELVQNLKEKSIIYKKLSIVNFANPEKRNGIFYKVKREILFAIPFLKYEPFYLFKLFFLKFLKIKNNYL